MKKLPTSRSLLAAILALACFGSSLRADETKPPVTPSAVSVPVKPPAKLINIDFPGGTVAQFVAAVAKSDSGTFNVIGEKEEMDVILPPISIHNVEFTVLPQTL